jgi:lipopolysaccharide export system protein LptA
MSPSIKNLRRGVVTGGVALLVVLAVFLGVARLKGHHFHLDLPGRLGVDISQTANGFTWSQSSQGHTLFTIHASKLVQYKNDQAELHDVTITLYGPEGSGRTDKIYGADFKYDRKRGIARATGAVQIDFASPQAKPEGKPGASGPALARQDGSTIHVTTSSLVFNQATGEASTDQRVDFVLPRATGSAMGAEYNAKSGVLVLDSQVALVTTSSPAGQPAAGIGDTTIHAEHAQLLRDTHQAYLIKDEATSEGKHTTSDQATITFRPDGSAQHIDAQGHVHVTTDDGSEVHASTAAIDLDALSHPLVADLAGGVTYQSSDSDRTLQGTAVSGTLAFAASPPPPGPGKPKPPAQQQLKHAQFRDAVTFVLQQHSLNGDPNGSATREMSASKLDIDFGPGPDGKAEAQHVLGAGGATATLHDVPSKGASRSTTISGDQLLATLVNGRVFKMLDGKGNTKIVDSSSDGATSTSTGDTLHVTFLDPALAKAPASSTAQVDTAVQTGNVTLLQISAPGSTSDKKPDAKSSGPSSPPSPLHATAQRAEYQAADQVLHLTGDPHLRNDTFTLTADTVDYHRDSGDATATGDVKSTYTQQSGQKAPTLGGDGPVHVTAERAQITGSSDISVFYGTATEPARLWQGGDAVAAPVIELSKYDQTLDAHGARGDHGAVVHTTLGSKTAGSRSGAAKSAGASTTGSVPVRLTSATLHYADQDHRVDLRGSVTAEQPTGTVHADQAQIYLTPPGPNTTGPNTTAANTPGQLDHMVATGHVIITQPGRRGTGDKLVYTAADGRYVLTGTPSQPPRIADAQKGTTTGAALLFKTADDSVEVSSHVDPVPGSAAVDMHAHTVTDTHTPK